MGRNKHGWAALLPCWRDLQDHVVQVPATNREGGHGPHVTGGAPHQRHKQQLSVAGPSRSQGAGLAWPQVSQACAFILEHGDHGGDKAARCKPLSQALLLHAADLRMMCS